MNDETKLSEVTHYEFERLPDDGYFFKYETSDGQTRNENGYFKNIGDQRILVVSGSYSYIGSDGKNYQVRYTSDEKGYRASGDHLLDTGTDVEEVVGFGPPGPIEVEISPSLIASLTG